MLELINIFKKIFKINCYRTIRNKNLVSLFSLVVEHLPRKQKVEGSIPLTGFFY